MAHTHSVLQDESRADKNACYTQRDVKERLWTEKQRRHPYGNATGCENHRPHMPPYYFASVRNNRETQYADAYSDDKY